MSVHSEADAKTKWCPLSRVLPSRANDNGTVGAMSSMPVYNRVQIEGRNEPFITFGANCIGCQCMAWRWSRAKETKAYLDAVQARMKATNANFNVATQKVWAEIGSTFEKTEGYCGAFGAPNP